MDIRSVHRLDNCSIRQHDADCEDVTVAKAQELDTVSDLRSTGKGKLGGIGM